MIKILIKFVLILSISLMMNIVDAINCYGYRTYAEDEVAKRSRIINCDQVCAQIRYHLSFIKIFTNFLV